METEFIAYIADRYKEELGLFKTMGYVTIIHRYQGQMAFDPNIIDENDHENSGECNAV